MNVPQVKPEITILALHLHYGGVEKYLSSLCQMLHQDYSLHIIATYRIAKQPAFEFASDVRITYLIDGGPNHKALQRAFQNFHIFQIGKELGKSIRILCLRKYRNIQAIRKIRSQYIVTTRPFHSRLVGRYAPKYCIKIATEHNDLRNQRRYNRRLIASLKGFDYLVTVSESLREFYQTKIGPTKCIFIPNVINTLPPSYPLTQGTQLVSVGRLEKEKGFETLMEVVALVKKKLPSISLYLIGDGSQKESLQKQIYDLGLAKNVILTGFLSSCQIAEYFKRSQLFVMTSYSESFGLVLIEAMSYHVPCIAFDLADGAKTLLQGNHGILIEKRDRQAMADKIVEILNDEKYRRTLAENSYLYCQRYLACHVAKEWQSFLKTACKEGYQK